MKNKDLEKIEVELSIKLPECYKKSVLNFPLAFGRGKSSYFLWDEPQRIISENKRLRRNRAWKNIWFFIGNDGAGYQHAMNLRQEKKTIHDIEFEDTAKTINTGLTIERWIDLQLSNLEDSGVDITSNKDSRLKSDWRVYVKCLFILLGGAIIITFIIFIISYIIHAY